VTASKSLVEQSRESHAINCVTKSWKKGKNLPIRGFVLRGKLPKSVLEQLTQKIAWISFWFCSSFLGKLQGLNNGLHPLFFVSFIYIVPSDPFFKKNILYCQNFLSMS